jgi:methyl-accepting chemotaxis protein
LGLSIVLIHAAYVVVHAGLLIYIASNMKADAQTGRELAVLGDNLPRQAGKFDLRFPPMALAAAGARCWCRSASARGGSSITGRN